MDELMNEWMNSWKVLILYITGIQITKKDKKKIHVCTVVWVQQETVLLYLWQCKSILRMNVNAQKLLPADYTEGCRPKQVQDLCAAILSQLLHYLLW